MSMRSAIVPLLAVLAAALAAPALAQYPVRPIRLVVPTAPGGGMDLVGRLIAQKLGDRLGQQVVVDNRPGASEIIGTDIVVRAAPDAYAILLVNMAFAANPGLFERLPYDSATALAPVTLIASLPSVLVTHPSVPAKTAAELITLAKARPGTLNYGSAGTGTSLHLITELFKNSAGLSIVHVPYKGAGPALSALLANEIALTFIAIPPAHPHIRSGRLTALGVTSAKRMGALPEVPTIGEAALPGFEVNDWQAILAPAGTPAQLLATLNREIVAALNAADVNERITGLGAVVVASTPAELARHLSKELATWSRVIKAAGIRAD
jgi:tripartite-type tricarboxylate transporter receptor subunit TctC